MNEKLVVGGGETSVNGRIVGLDILRIWLALLIFMFHSNLHFHCNYWILNSFVNMGAIAMTAFFILSGYCIEMTNTSLNIGDIESLKRFYIKRSISILPLYFFIHIVRMFLWNSESFIDRVLMFPIQSLCIQSQFSTISGHAHNGGSWFISCIIACYFVFPLLHVIFKACSYKIRIIILLLLVFVLLWSPLVQIKLYANTLYANPFFRCVEFSIGILLFTTNKQYSLSNKYSKLMGWPTIICATIALVAGISFASRLSLPHDYMLFNWIALPCFIVLILCLGIKKISRWQDNIFIRYSSSISFTFFLAQMLGLWPTSASIVELIGYDNNIVRITVSFILCTMISIALHEFIEVKSYDYLKNKYLR